MPASDRVLIAIMNNHHDMIIAREDHWYRIPRERIKQRFEKQGLPLWLAFYQTKVFDDEAYSITYYGRIKTIETVYRYQLFPDELENEKTRQQYYQLKLAPLEQLVKPIRSDRPKRITFSFTTFDKLTTATSLNELR